MIDEQQGDEQESPPAEPEEEVPYPPPTMDTDWTRDDSPTVET